MLSKGLETYVLVISERQHVQSGGVSDDNSVATASSNGLHHISPIRVEIETLSVEPFAGPSV